MKYIISIIMISLILVSCSTTKTAVKVETNTIVVEPPLSIRQCPALGKLPNPDTLTNKELAELIKELYVKNKTCYINMKKINEFIEEAKKLNK